MKIKMKDLLINNVKQIDDFLKTNQNLLKLEIESTENKYQFIRNTLLKVRYRTLTKKEKNLVLKFLTYFTEYSKRHLKRLIKRWKKRGLYLSKSRNRRKFPVRYFVKDIALLIETDFIHECLSGEATKRILKREFEIFENQKYENISNISSSHIYNIRNHSNQYNSSKAKKFHKTKAIQVKIGTRKKPIANGKPGLLRVDTVHQGDKNRVKGVYHINMVDEVTQYEMVATVKKTSERYLRPVIKNLIQLFPFRIFIFHADNESEYINHITASLLNKLHIELTKSRSRYSNDNALVESKNGSVIRKHFGRIHIP